MMKIIKKIKYPAIYPVVFLCFFMSDCNKNITDFGNNAKLFGVIKDQKGNIVAGDITSNTLTIQALGEGDQVSTVIRVNGDGTYQNTKLFPKKYKIWLMGPVTMTGEDTITLDFSSQKVYEHDFVVIPFISVETPAVVGNPTSSSVSISYEISENDNYTVAKREIYISTVPYPNAQTGSGPFYNTKTMVLSSNKGEVTINGLSKTTKYFARIGAKAAGANGMNYSQQIIVTTP